MAEKNKKADGVAMATEIPVVAPINIGKGFKWDASTKKYNIDIAPQNARVGSGLTIGPNGAVNVALSKDPTNLLQMKPDGVYYGIKPPANLENLYVDAENGVDQHPDDVEGAGTRSKPLRTIAYAFSVMVPNTQSTLYLHTHQQHIVERPKVAIMKAQYVRILPYGDQFEADLKGIHNGGFSPAVVSYIERGLAPVIVFRGYTTSTYPSVSKERTVLHRHCIHIPTTQRLSAEGIIFRDDLSDHIVKNSQATTDAFSVSDGNRISAVAGASVELYRCKLEDSGEPSFDTALNQSSVSHVRANPRSLFGFLTGTNVNLILYDLLGIPSKSYILGTEGWSAKMTPATSVSLRTIGSVFAGEKIREVTALIHNKVIDTQNGVKQVIVPKVDISATFFD